MEAYQVFKHAHMGFAALTILSFSGRGILRFTRPELLAAKPLRILPHVIDTLLLASAIGMLMVAQLNPLEASWVMAKIVGLLCYIVLGTFALKRARTRQGRLLAFAAALLTLGYIVAVAFTKQVWLF
jgi:uncharacterized membrane protein SirB2